MPPSYTAYDGLAYEYNDSLFHEWRKGLLKEDLMRAIGRLISKHRVGGRPVELHAPRKGVFNVHYRLAYAQKPDAEVTALRCLADHTSVSVPCVLHHGTRDESPGDEQLRSLGPFVDTPVLDPGINDATLVHWYGQMAGVLLQLLQCTFDAIGPLTRNGDGTIGVGRRPLSLNLAQFGNLARVPASVLPDQLSFQRNNAVTSAADARKKYVARQLSRKLAAEDRLAGSTDAESRGPFPLWCDDLRSANVLVKDNAATDTSTPGSLAAVIDWEYSYATPVDFVRCPSWWLLLVPLEECPRSGRPAWTTGRRTTRQGWTRFCSAWPARGVASQDMPAADWPSRCATAGRRTTFGSSMRPSALVPLMPYAMYWRFLDTKFCGPYPGGSPERGGASRACKDSRLDARLGELSGEQVAAMDAFVARKMREKDQRRLVDWYTSNKPLPSDV